ncbi:hypothetical protein KDL01_06450 [Actinospica durhamensis]|uniref:Uncharacterized protein n=1 Tax=Actinospica durhamensis TaxID=1508375 RepID=A0A941ES90_9ACTN|nr:hypothetical protein [Actinospica durhamensis]MBR7832894.1 hypothetical protein [Actinospica durhamensis]
MSEPTTPADASNRADLPHRVGPWATRFDSDEALIAADDAARAYALEHHDLAPVLPFATVYGPGLHFDKATAIGISTQMPVNEDGSTNYTRGDFLGGLVYGVYRPAETANAAAGPADGEELWNTTLYPYPAGNLDPVSVPLAALGLEAPEVDRRFVNFCAGLLGCEAVDDLGLLRPTFDLAWPDYRACIGAGLLHLVQQRPISPETWYSLTYVPFEAPDQLALYLAQVYAYLFDDFDTMPVAPS